MENPRQIDAIVIGAGLGGLLSAAQLLKLGKSVVVLERLSHSGGRFTAKNFRGVQVSTGAVHMVPFGSNGVLAQMLRRLHVPHRFFDADVFGSFHVHGRQYCSRGLLGVFKFLPPYQVLCFLRIGYLMFLRRLPQHEQSLPFDLWLKSHADLDRVPQLVAFFQSIARFALSLELSQVSIAEVIRTAKNMLRYGPPAIVQGGCGGLTKQLEETIISLGGEVWLACEVLQILHENGSVVGVCARNKVNREEVVFTAPLVISDIGPQGTSVLLDPQRVYSANRCITQTEVRSQAKSHADDETQPTKGIRQQAQGEALLSKEQAIGLKVHILSDISLIPHKGIMYCLDTKRIAGMVQPTNSDPGLAPEGKHLLISHQVIQSNNIEQERALALADLRTLFGEAFDTHCRILTMGTYRGEWPVNRLAQGSDTTTQTSIRGLYLVGDAVKPPGYLMVEGVAQSVNYLLDLLDEAPKGNIPKGHTATDQKQEIVKAGLIGRSQNVTTPPSRLNAIRWLLGTRSLSRDGLVKRG